jgi:hypothetical protein
MLSVCVCVCVCVCACQRVSESPFQLLNQQSNFHYILYEQYAIMGTIQILYPSVSYNLLITTWRKHELNLQSVYN